MYLDQMLEQLHRAGLGDLINWPAVTCMSDRLAAIAPPPIIIKPTGVVSSTHTWTDLTYVDSAPGLECLYLAGPMRGRPRFNFAAFDSYRNQLLASRYYVMSPADMDRIQWGRCPLVDEAFYLKLVAELEDDPATLKDMLRRDLNAIADHATGIAMMPGWEDSKGATVEWSLARALGLKVHYLT